MWLTQGDESKKLSQEPSIDGGDWNDVEWTIDVDRNDRDQSILGFGAALSNSAAYLFHNSPSKTEILNDLFGADGIGISYIRLVMGGSDFNAVEPYTYDDIESGDDFDMSQFSIDKDQEFVIPVLRDILAINPNVKILATPWSAPAWMKNPRSLNGGRLRNDGAILEALAEYFVRFIQAYDDEGITIDAVTLQNEPEHASGGYPTMQMSWQEQRDLIRDHLGPKLADAQLNTDIILWDHNWDNPGFSIDILNDAGAKQYIAGSGFHCYAGDKNAPQQVKNAHPDKDIYFTECSGGEWDTNFGSGFGWNLQNLFIGQTRVSSRNVLLWNLALDENYGPREGVTAGCSDCRGVVTIPSWGGYDRNVEYYSIGHFSKFVPEGSIKIGTNNFGDNLESVAFETPEGKVVVVVLHTWWDGEKTFQVNIDGQFYRVDNLPGRSAVTLVQN